jgi:hypothetical protein
LITVFALVSIERLAVTVAHGWLGIDFSIYREAAIAMLAGHDPYAVTVQGFAFAGTPPALLAFVPAALLPTPVAMPVYAAVFVAAWLTAVRALRLPVWWLMFPPVVEALTILNPDALLVVLLIGGSSAAGVAVMLKSYAAVPLALQGRWKALALGALLSAITLPLWIPYLQGAATINAALAQQSDGGLSAWGQWLAVPTVIALLALRGRGASWLVVPALWPYSQFHYAAIAVPYARKSALVAFLLSFANPLFPAIAVILEAVRVRVGERMARPIERVDGTREAARPPGSVP